MIAEGIEKVQQLVRAADDASLIDIVRLDWDGSARDYQFRRAAVGDGRQLGDVVQPFRPPKLDVSTLTGFLDAIAAGVCGDITSGKIIHVEDYLNVSVKTTASDPYGVRSTLLKATHTPINAFEFDKYYEDPQKFIIACQVAFLQTEEMLYLLNICKALKAGNSVQTSDDGFSQTVTVKRGEVGAADVPIKPRIKLVPLRSFAELGESNPNPVQSEFLVRFRQGNAEQPSIALFAIDGAKWKSEIMRSIKHYLEKDERLAGVHILA